MTEKYKIPDILEAVSTLLNNNKERPLILKENKKRPLKLTNQVRNPKTELNNVPKDTEKIILQAEKYLKK